MIERGGTGTSGGALSEECGGGVIIIKEQPSTIIIQTDPSPTYLVLKVLAINNWESI